MVVSLQRACAIFGNSAAPAVVWQRQFDYFDDNLKELAQTPLDRIDRSDLWYYYHDLAYCELQPELFAYLFPLCLWDWHLTLQANEPCSHGDSDFHKGLYRGNVLEKMTTPDQREQIYSFLHDSLLEKIDQISQIMALSRLENLAWLWRLNSLASIVPQVERLWTVWWSMETPGRAMAAVQYVSDLLYFAEENPIFANFPDRPGSDDLFPMLAGHDSLIWPGWLPVNLDFIRTTLTADEVDNSLKGAIAALRATPEVRLVQRFQQDFPDRREILESRLSELPNLLENSELQGWSL